MSSQENTCWVCWENVHYSATSNCEGCWEYICESCLEYEDLTADNCPICKENSEAEVVVWTVFTTEYFWRNVEVEIKKILE